jgi:hypothetical protein
MIAWRIIFAAFAVVLAGVVLMDIVADRERPKRILEYEIGTYLGQTDTPMSDDARREIRARGAETRGW